MPAIGDVFAVIGAMVVLVCIGLVALKAYLSNMRVTDLPSGQEQGGGGSSEHADNDKSFGRQ